ncbi:hypothetical protein [Medusavirus stheno T3]|uniref:Uncharacterized protein n=1 Tax=Medusavirus stheno T3 TaxID=3069717 RepID=A0A7S7YEZ3_9VIRU|nr:hypothetical protein QKU73_gp208 [Acanthamoeba castellanii medusavirus]QPB44567.1 hypothetical protein [Medusavirus stheno T3]
MRRQAPRKKSNVRQAAKPVVETPAPEAPQEQPAAVTKAKAVSDPPFTAVDPATGDPQVWMVWSYVAPVRTPTNFTQQRDAHCSTFACTGSDASARRQGGSRHARCLHGSR